VYTCFAYGLSIQSELPLLDSIEDRSEPDVTVRFSSLSEVSVQSNQGSEILVSLPSGLKLWVRGGREVIVDAPSGFEAAVVRAYILGAAMACVLRQRGFLVLHASCVAQEGRAIAFLGGSGWGKSTLASLFHQHGYFLLTDDVMALQMNEPLNGPSERNSSEQENRSDVSPLVVPSFPEVKLLPDAAAAVGVTSDGPPRLQSLSSKHIQRLDRHAAHPIPLKHLYVLRVGEVNDITSVPGPLAFTELIQHSRATKTMADTAFMVQHFHQCSALIKTVPVSYLQRPRSLEQLPNLIELIESHLNSYSN
jgi:hypothetical protein